jgi:hypothetical protein
MSTVRRKIKNGCVIVQGRKYAIHHGFPKSEAKKLEGVSVYVDDDGVIQTDNPKLGLRTTSSVRVFGPRPWNYLHTFHLQE